MPIEEGLVEISPLAASDKRPGSPIPVVAAGWGQTGLEERTLPTQLQTGNFSIVYYETCNPAWSDKNPITAQMVCFQPTGAPENFRSSACNGDNGGPVLSVADGSLVGVISHTDACSSTRPNVAANVEYVASWIRNNM